MNSFRTKLITSTLGYGFVIGAVVWAVLTYIFPAYYTNWFFGILVFFLIIEPLAVSYIEGQSKTVSDRQLVNSYMLTKVVKIVAVLGFVLVYYVIEGKENIKNFVIALLAFYFLFLIIETISFAKIEKHLKEKKQ